MKTAVLVLAGLAALGLAACTPPYARHDRWGSGLKSVAKLDCPTSQGDLSLKSAASDGRSCVYAGEDGSDVRLTLVSTPDGPDAVLSKTEADLKALLPSPPAVDVDAKTPPKPTEPVETVTPSTSPDGKEKNVNIRLPGIVIHAGDEKANISVGGLHIDADDSTDTVHVRGGRSMGHNGQFTVDADHNGAVIRAKGGGPDVRATLILASDQTGAQGWHVVGYEARGPRAGPLVLATVKSRSNQHDSVFEDVKSLVRRSAGG